MIDVDNVSEKYRKRPNPRIRLFFSDHRVFARWKRKEDVTWNAEKWISSNQSRKRCEKPMDVARRHPIYEHPNHRKNKLKTERRKRKRWSRLAHRSNWRGFSNLSDWLRADRGASHYKNEISFVAGRVDGNRRQDDDTAPCSTEDGSSK